MCRLIRTQQHGSKYFARRSLLTLPPHPLTLWLGSNGQTSTFPEHGHVAYQIKENHEHSTMVANILPADPLPTLSTQPPDPVVGVKRSKFNFFSEHGHVAYQIIKKAYSNEYSWTESLNFRPSLHLPPILCVCEQQMLWRVCAYAQAHLMIRCSTMRKVRESHVLTYL